MKEKYFTRGIAAAVFLLAVGLFIAMPASVEAKTANNILEPNKTYTQYDITGDKKADTLLISAPWQESNGMYKKCDVFVNGKKVLSQNDDFYSYELEIRRLKLNNGKVYLSIIPFADDSDIPGAGIYQYKQGKLKKVINLDAMSKIGYHNSVSKIVVSGNRIGVTYQEMSYSLGYISFRLDYVYKKGNMVQKTTKPKLKETYLNSLKKSYWTADRSMDVLKKAPDGKKIATLKSGKKVKIDKIYINARHDKIYLHVKIKGGKSGWVKGMTKYPRDSKPWFREVLYAG